MDKEYGNRKRSTKGKVATERIQMGRSRGKKRIKKGRGRGRRMHGKRSSYSVKETQYTVKR
jgi:hypothetical protein